MSEDKTTATPGAEPGDTEIATPDLTQKVLDSLPSEDAKTVDPSTTTPAKAETLPWDKDPRWKSARTAEKNMNSMLETHGYSDMKELEADLAKGSELKDLLGGRDAKKLISASDTLEKYEEHWAAQKLKELEEDEEPEDTIERLRKEAQEAKSETRKVRQENEFIADNKAVMERYDSTVRNAVKDSDLSETESKLANLFLGVDNPAVSVDINNKKAVTKMAKEGLGKFSTYMKEIKQAAIDDYAKGKSKIVPITKSGTEATVQKKQLSKDASIDETFQSARSEILEMIQKAA